MFLCYLDIDDHKLWYLSVLVRLPTTAKGYDQTKMTPQVPSRGHSFPNPWLLPLFTAQEPWESSKAHEPLSPPESS